MAWVLSFNSHLLTSPFTFKRNILQEGPWHRVKVLGGVRLGVTALELLGTLGTLPATMGSKVMLHIIAHGIYVLIRAGILLATTTLHIYRHHVQVLINQTLKINLDFGPRFLGRKEVENKRRELFFVLMLLNMTTAGAFFQMFGLFLTSGDLAFSVFPGSEALRGNVWALLLMAGIRVGFFLEEVGTFTLIVVGMFCLAPTMFWLKKAW